MPDRLQERAELKRLVILGKSVQMLAPRRIGKTWLMDKLADDLEGAGWMVIYIDLQGKRTTNAFLEALCNKLQAKENTRTLITVNLKQRLGQLLGGGWDGNPLEAITKLDVVKFSEALIASINEGGKNAIILIDEIALFVLNLIEEDPKKARDFLYHLRGLRQGYPNVRWFFAGSIGLDVVARRHGLQGAQLGMHPFLLEPFNAAATRNFIRRLCERGAVAQPFVLDEEASDHFVSELGWLSPFYIELLANVIKPTRDPVTKGGLPVACRDDVERSFAVLLRPEYREQFAAWEEHIAKNFPRPEAASLLQILDLCCVSTDGEIADTLQARLTGNGPPIPMREIKNHLTSLSNEGFLHKKNERWCFRSGLLRRFWMEYMI